MAALAPEEVEMAAMFSTWAALSPVREFELMQARFIREELPAVGFDAAGMTAALRLAIEFREIWPHRVPLCWELVLADRSGRLEERINELELEFTAG